MTQKSTKCHSCGDNITGEIYHLGFSSMEALYCSGCPNVLLIKDFALFESRGIKVPRLKAGDDGWEYYDRHLLPVFAAIESLFKPCTCGGRFGYMNPPRCPKCSGYLHGDCYEDKPILKERDKYVFVSIGFITDREQLKE